MPPITSSEVLELLRTERAELIEQWTDSATLAVELERVALNASWNLEWVERSKAHWISELRETGELRATALEMAAWLATRDDLWNRNVHGLNPDLEPLDETQLRSGWFSTS